MIDITFVRLSETAILPTKAYPTDAGIDLFANLESDYILPSFESILVPTGFSIIFNESKEWNNIDYLLEAQVRSKSGLALNDNLIVLNSPGTIDQDYTGEIKVILYNASYKTKLIKKNQKVAQLVVNFVPVVRIKEVVHSDNHILSSNNRGVNGFGSTGIN